MSDNDHEVLPKLYTEEQAAALLLIAPRTLRALRAAGKIAYVRVSPRRIRYKESQIEQYISDNRYLGDKHDPYL